MTGFEHPLNYSSETVNSWQTNVVKIKAVCKYMKLAGNKSIVGTKEMLPGYEFNQI